MDGIKAVCGHLLSSAQFNYVCLRQIQSDRIEGEFGVFRQSTGANKFMSCGDVFSANQKRLAKYAASYLQLLELDSTTNEHNC